MNVIKNIKELLLVKNNINIVFLLLIAVISTLPLKELTPKLLFALFVIQLIIVTYNNKKEIETNLFFWLLITLFSLNIVGLLYSENLSRGFVITIRQLSFVLFPLFYTVYKIKDITLLFKVFIVAIFIFILIYEIDTIYRFFYTSDVFPLDIELFLSYRYTGAEVTKLTEMHPAYFGMYITFSNVLIISFLKNSKRTSRITLLILLILFQSLFVLQIVAKTAIILNTLIVIFSLIYFLLKQDRLKSLIVFIVLLFLISWVLSKRFQLPLQRIQDRFYELQSPDNTTRQVRTKIWKASIPIIKDNLVIGVGTGDVEKIFHKELAKNNLIQKSNVHNQYLDYLMRYGLLGLIAFLSTIGYALCFAIKKRSYVFFSFTIIIVGACMTENIFNSLWGVSFYTSFNYLLYLYSYRNKKITNNEFY